MQFGLALKFGADDSARTVQLWRGTKLAYDSVEASDRHVQVTRSLPL